MNTDSTTKQETTETKTPQPEPSVIEELSPAYTEIEAAILATDRLVYLFENDDIDRREIDDEVVQEIATHLRFARADLDLIAAAAEREYRNHRDEAAKALSVAEPQPTDAPAPAEATSKRPEHPVITRMIVEARAHCGNLARSMRESFGCTRGKRESEAYEQMAALQAVLQDLADELGADAALVDWDRFAPDGEDAEDLPAQAGGAS